MILPRDTPDLGERTPSPSVVAFCYVREIHSEHLGSAGHPACVSPLKVTSAKPWSALLLVRLVLVSVTLPLLVSPRPSLYDFLSRCSAYASNLFPYNSLPPMCLFLSRSLSVAECHCIAVWNDVILIPWSQASRGLSAWPMVVQGSLTSGQLCQDFCFLSSFSLLLGIELSEV